MDCLAVLQNLQDLYAHGPAFFVSLAWARLVREAEPFFWFCCLWFLWQQLERHDPQHVLWASCGQLRLWPIFFSAHAFLTAQ